jgi:hypothetical protein
VLKLTLRSLHHRLAVCPLPVHHRHLEVHHRHLARNRHQVVLLPGKVRLRRLLTIQLVLRLQINLLLKVAAVVNPEQVKLKQPTILKALHLHQYH